MISHSEHAQNLTNYHSRTLPCLQRLTVDGGALESEIDVFQGKDSGMALESALSISFEFSLVVLIDLNGSDS